MDKIIQQLETIAAASPESEWFTAPRAKEAAKLLRECRDMMQSFVNAGDLPPNEGELKRHVDWARELLA